MAELEQYDYDLPRDLIAQQPLPQRSDARLLIVDRSANSMTHTHVRDLPELLDPGDCLVLNNSRVIPARLLGYRTDTRGRWEGLFLTADDRGNWKLLCKTRSRLRPGTSITLVDRDARDDVRLQMLAPLGNGQWAARPESDESTLRLLERVGRVPLPRYIRGGEMVQSDWQTYQTVYARDPGSVAAPTAGLHFTENLLQRIESRGVAICHVTLHVGMGTFRPITADDLADHRMHSELGCLDASAVERMQNARQAGRRIVAVGTTSMRVLETAAAEGELGPWSGETDLFIRPPYTFHAVSALLTNFHLPRSTLLVLVRTFGGDRLIRRAYDEAIEQRYRFYSYGDAMLVL